MVCGVIQIDRKCAPHVSRGARENGKIQDPLGWIKITDAGVEKHTNAALILLINTEQLETPESVGFPEQK